MSAQPSTRPKNYVGPRRPHHDVPGVCDWCGATLPSGLRCWCSEACTRAWLETWYWPNLCEAVYRRERGRCQRCGLDVGGMRERADRMLRLARDRCRIPDHDQPSRMQRDPGGGDEWTERLVGHMRLEWVAPEDWPRELATFRPFPWRLEGFGRWGNGDRYLWLHGHWWRCRDKRPRHPGSDDLHDAIGRVLDRICQRYDLPRFRAWHEFHHVVARSEGGRDSQDNLELLCVPCHKRETAALARRGAEARRQARREAALATQPGLLTEEAN